jgi:hypothetical protein
MDCRPTGSYPETGLEEINSDLPEADFNPATVQRPKLETWTALQSAYIEGFSYDLRLAARSHPAGALCKRRFMTPDEKAVAEVLSAHNLALNTRRRMPALW